jgi:Skp family chaperone for outer membrane proteins
MLQFQITILLLALATPLTAADDGKPQSTQVAGNRIGVVDVNQLFKKHAGLKEKLIALQVEASLTQAKYESELKTNAKKAQQLKNLTSESQDYKKLDDDIIKDKARIETEIALARKDFTRREARLYLDTYQQIKKDVEKIAKEKHLVVVLNENLGEMKTDNPEDVARGISAKVLWFDDSTNLTPQLEGNYAPDK